MRSSGLPVPGTVHIRAAPAGAAIALSPAIAAMTPVIRVRDMITLYPRPRSSAGQSIRLLSGGSQVRVLAGALAASGIAARLVRRGWLDDRARHSRIIREGRRRRQPRGHGFAALVRGRLDYGG